MPIESAWLSVGATAPTSASGVVQGQGASIAWDSSATSSVRGRSSPPLSPSLAQPHLGHRQSCLNTRHGASRRSATQPERSGPQPARAADEISWPSRIHPPAPAIQLPMEYRRLGRSGFKVPELSFGRHVRRQGHSSRPGARPTSPRPRASSTSASTPASTCSTPPTSTPTARPRRSSARRSGPARAGADLDQGHLPHRAGPERRRLVALPLIQRVEAQPAAPGHRLHRPLPAARLRRADPGRGDAAHAGRPRPRRQDPLHRRARTSPAGT